MEDQVKNNEGRKVRPFMANVSIKLQVPENMTDEEVHASLSEMAGEWTGARYTGEGPSGPILDVPAGWDF
jgi:hypothetical protein